VDPKSDEIFLHLTLTLRGILAVLSKVNDFATFKKVEVHPENSTLKKVEVE